ncbi:HAD-IA family hydrolase [Aliiroseovarius zhejiangensis]|uniref:HAD-IA family hydrolase n=1 Tax=Aliiroseovarius zhejiangensis TaxID=1632025 RepID=UPI0038992039
MSRNQTGADESRLHNAVDGIVYSAKTGGKKPSGQFYAIAAQVTGRQPGHLPLVDDSLANIKASRTSGWSAVHWDGTEKAVRNFAAQHWVNSALDRFPLADIRCRPRRDD